MGSLERQQKPSDSSTESARSDPFPPGTAIARYRVLSFIGSGAMGDVYRAHDRALDREVALKVLPPELTGDRERVRRFAQEARAASALSHPHIVTIHEVGHARPTLSVRPIDEHRPARRTEVHYIAMELIEGQTLREALLGHNHNNVPMPIKRAVELLAQVADGLGKAHGAGIIHRDLKPDNILVANDGYAKIVDFGLAKLIDTSWNPIGADSPTLRALTAHGQLLGTPGYMAPEQISGKTPDPRADIFSFGCILYEAIARVRPFEAESFVDTLYKIMHEEPAPLARHVPDVSPELQPIVMRCLAKDRELRYQSIRDVAADLRAATSSVGHFVSPAPARSDARPMATWKPALLVLAVLAFLGWLMLERKTTAPAVTQSVQRITSDGRALLVAVSANGRYVAYVSKNTKGQTLILKQVSTGAMLTVVPPSPLYHYAGIAFSRDGEQLFFTRYDNDTIGNLHRVSILGGVSQAIIRDIDSRVAISPDGSQLAFVRDDINRATSLLMIANTDGSNVHTLAHFGFADRLLSPVWSPDGTRIMAAQQSKLVEIAFPSGKVRRVDPSVSFDGLRQLAWPEENRVIAAAAKDDGGSHSRLWAIDPSSGETSALTSDLTDLFAPAVSSDGATAALQAIREANVFEVRADGTTKPLTSGVGASNGLSGVALVDGRVVYASSADGRFDLWSLGDGDTRRLTDDPAYESLPTPSPDGSALFYLSSAGGNTTLWRMRPDGSDRRALTSGPRDGDFAVSPDSRSIAFATLDPKTKTWELSTMPAAGGARRVIATRSNILDQVRYSPDGKMILFTGYDNSALRVYRIPAAGGTMQTVVDGRAQGASISPDGTTLAAVGGADGMTGPIELVSLRNGAVKTLAAEGATVRWKPDGSALTYVRDGNLWLLATDGGTSKKLTSFNEGAITDYTWSADGTRAIVAHVTDAVDVVVIR
jgi:Tol biopolymer transport system component